METGNFTKMLENRVPVQALISHCPARKCHHTQFQIGFMIVSVIAAKTSPKLSYHMP